MEERGGRGGKRIKYKSVSRGRVKGHNDNYYCHTYVLRREEEDTPAAA